MRMVESSDAALAPAAPSPSMATADMSELGPSTRLPVFPVSSVHANASVAADAVGTPDVSSGNSSGGCVPRTSPGSAVAQDESGMARAASPAAAKSDRRVGIAGLLPSSVDPHPREGADVTGS